jgi:hypothetical protein
MLSPAWLGSKEFSGFVVQNEQQFRTLLIELGLLK